MRIAGVICEYNPFHGGHAYHLRHLRRSAQADAVICLMSGEFTQRGEPSVCDKWTRAEMALRSGADAVIELPFVHVVRSAQQFAQAGVGILDALGCACIGFGAETACLEQLQDAARILLRQPPGFQKTLRSSLDAGASYSRAVRDALNASLSDAEALTAGSNNMLAVQYLRALSASESSMEPVVTPRQGQGHGDCGKPGEGVFASSAAIRQAVSDPRGCVSAVLRRNRVPVQFEPMRGSDVLFALLTAKLRGASPGSLENISGMEPGLPWKLIRAAETARTLEEMIRAITSRRYTASRIRRLLMNAYFGITDSLYQQMEHQYSGVQLLGIRKASRYLLSWFARCASIPVAPGPRQLPDSPETRLSVQACDLYGLLMKPVRAARQDYRRRLLMI